VSNFKEEIAETIKFIDEIFRGNGSIIGQPFKSDDIKSESTDDCTIVNSLISILTTAHKIDSVNNKLNEETNILYKENNKIIEELWQHLKKISCANKNNPSNTVSSNDRKMTSVSVDKTSEEIRRKMEKIDKISFNTHLKLVKKYRVKVRTMFYHYFQNLHRQSYVPTVIKLKDNLQTPPKNVQKLTEIQWKYCLNIAQQLTADDPARHEKTLFIMTLFYWLYPRVSELVVRGKWIPLMKHFYHDEKEDWWFKVLDKNKKIRCIGVSPEMLEALKRYRISQGFLTPLPRITDAQPILPNEIGRAITRKTAIRTIVQDCFDKVIEALREDNLGSEADTMELATITYLRQTGILDDINKRGFSNIQVREKAGENLLTLSTYRYNDSLLRERHQSAKNKKLIEKRMLIHSARLVWQKNLGELNQQLPQGAIKRLTDIQWRYCVDAAIQLAASNPERYEKTLFIIAILYLLYPLPSELLASSSWTPKMNHFYQDSNQNWWFKVHKNGRVRAVAVSDDMLNILKRYRLSQGLTPLPLPIDSMPLLVRKRGEGAIAHMRKLKDLVQPCFDQAIIQLRKNELVKEANTLRQATIIWIRYTGISDDINKRGRPIEHVIEDAGYTGGTSNLYIGNDLFFQKK